MKKYIIRIPLLLMMGIMFLSCSDFTDGINVSPNDFTSSPGNLLVGQAQLEVVILSGSNNSRFAGIFTDQFTGADRQYLTVQKYGVTAGDFDDTWDDLYVGGVTNAQIAKDAGIESGDDLLAGVSGIMEALLIGEATALWGDIPYTEACDIQLFRNPNYDSQVSVLAAVQTLLSDAIAKLGSAGVANVYNTAFTANDAKWDEVAHTLKARYYLIAKDYPNALIEAQQGIQTATGSLLSSHGTATGSRNLYYQFEEEQRGGYLTATDSHLTKLLTGVTARAIATPGDSERFKDYFIQGTDEVTLNTAEDGYFGTSASYPIVSFIENKLIEAEAAQRTGGDALTPFNSVRTHLATKYSASFPQSSSTGASLLEEILEEKYISLPGSLQIFHDARRTKNLLGVPNKGTNSASIPQRFFYPQSEINANSNFGGLVDLFTPTPINQ
jgi:hypothetical protein